MKAQGTESNSVAEPNSSGAAADMRKSDRRMHQSRRASDANKTVRLTRIKQWYFPVDAVSYKALMELGIPLTRIHQNFLPTLALVNSKRRKVTFEAIDFNEQILNPFLDKLGAAWQARQFRVATLDSRKMIFETTNSTVLEATKPALEKLETTIRRFFTRWGFISTFDLSEKRGKWKLYVKYSFSSDKMPIIPLIEDPTSLPVVRIRLGFLRLSFALGEKSIEINVAQAAGSQWTSLYTSSCLYSQISDVRPLIRTLMEVTNKNPENFDMKVDS